MENTCNTCHVQQNGCQCDSILDVPCCGKTKCNPCWDTCMCMEEILKLQKCGVEVRQGLSDLSDRIEDLEDTVQNYYDHFDGQINILSNRIDAVEQDLVAVWQAIHAAENVIDQHSTRLTNLETRATNLEANKFGYAEYDSVNKEIVFYANNTDTPRRELRRMDATPFIKDGMVNNVRINGEYLEITFNVDSGKETIDIKISDLVDPLLAQADWNQTDITAKDFIKNKPSLATVATSGSYNDLTNKPSIPAAQIQSDWNQANTSAVDYIKNKPTIPAAVDISNCITGVTINGNTLTFTRAGGANPITITLPATPASLWVDDPANNTLKPATAGRTVTSAGFYDSSINAPSAS